MTWLENLYPYLKLDALSRFIAAAIIFFGILIILYSLKFMQGRKRLGQYYTYIILTVIAALGVVLANDLVWLLVFWGFLGLTLYLLINMGGENASATAKKTFIIVGGSDSLIILGISIIYVLARTFQMDKINIALNNPLAGIAFVSLALASFAKAGAMPLHSWIPDCAQDAPIPVTAFLPASLDKLLGIYLLARMALNLFVLNLSANLFLMFIGAFTIVAAVMMALIQHDLKRLLGYHAVSQVGYMVLGIGTGTPIGIAGGIFHMLNHAIYKCCLFLTGGAVEHRTGTTELDKLGGLMRFMPITFLGCLVASLSISGIPPFNGFVSKWMVYQGVIELNKTGTQTWVILLAAAVIGSALTLASFLKLLHATFLGVAPHQERLKEVSWPMWLPVAILALLCILFGVFAHQLPLKYFIIPSVEGVEFSGLWTANLATALLIVGLVLGGVIYLAGNLKKLVREDVQYTGGEVIPTASRVSGVDFYNTIKEISVFKYIYKQAEAKVYDIYDQGKRLVFAVTKKFRHLHNGILPNYLVWCLLGMMVFFILFFKGLLR